MSKCKLLFSGGCPRLSPIKFRYKKVVLKVLFAMSRESMLENMDTGLSNLEILQEPEVREDQLTYRGF